MRDRPQLSGPSGPLAFRLDPEFTRTIAAAVADELERRGALGTPPASPWLDVAGAADYLHCSRQRVYDLISQGALTPARDGRRVLLRRDQIDAYLTAETRRAA